MVVRRIRSTVARLVLVSGLAATLIGGSVAIGQPTDTSAAPRTCQEALKLHEIYMTHGHAFFAAGNWSKASYYYGKAEGVLVAC